jgi:F-type H+-transporting ATPase subunit a
LAAGGSRRLKKVGGVVLILALLAGGLFFPVPMPEVSLAGERVFVVSGVPISNTMIAAWLTTVVLVVLAWLATRKMSDVPGGLQNVFEFVMETWLNLAEGIVGAKGARRYFPLFMTIFLFIVVANWLGLLPGFGSIGVWHNEGAKPVLVPFFRSANTDLNTTLALALISVFATQYYGARALGLAKHVGRFIDVRHGPIGFMIGFLELVGEIARILSFSFRLFGNIFAGEMLLAVLAFLVPWVVALPFLGLELFVGFIQGFIFAMLTLVFISVATAGHGESASESH